MAWESSSSDENVDRKRRRLSLPSLVADLFEDAGSEELLLAQAVKVEVVLTPNLRPFVLEASRKGQEKVVKQAVEDAAAGGEGGLLDPYGVALWPSALVLAQAVAAYIELNADQRLLELGAGCGLASLTAAHLGADVLASDFRQLPLELLHSAARRQGLRIRTAQLDINNLSVPLPPAEIVVASDVFYERTTAEAMAHRVAEAFRRGSVCLIADVGRPNREAFLTQLKQLLPEVAVDFSIEGLAIQETDADSAVGCAPRSVPVQLLELPGGGPAAAILSSSPARSIRPNSVGVSSLVESTCWQSES